MFIVIVSSVVIDVLSKGEFYNVIAGAAFLFADFPVL
jgi:hypothetical protein